MADTGKQDALKPVLQEAEDELSRRLHEACVAESTGLASKTSEEIREIEDSLLAAAVAAGQAISLRRHLQQRDAQDTASDAKLVLLPHRQHHQHVHRDGPPDPRRRKEARSRRSCEQVRRLRAERRQDHAAHAREHDERPP